MKHSKTIHIKTLVCAGVCSLFVCLPALSNAQMQMNISLLSTWTDTTLPKGWTGGSFNDCWGYVDSTGKEYAFIGSTLGTHIFDISNATSPVLVSFQTGRESSDAVVHRDYKTYQHYLYAVADEGNSSLQIFDLRYLPDSVHKVYDSAHICKTAHDIFIDHGRIYFCGLKDSANTSVVFRVASLANPENPVLIGDLASPPFGYVHDVNVRQDTAFLSCGNDGLFIYDYTMPAAPLLIGSITNYPEQGYNHASWVSANGKTLVFADETHGMGLKVYDISDLSNITLKSIFRSNLLNDTAQRSIPHNPFIVGNDRVVVSYYHDGVQVFDIANTSSPFNVGYYDTFPEDTTYTSYAGCWGVYPYLPSRHIIASDISHGLFILDGTQVLGVKEGQFPFYEIAVFPNPSNGTFEITSSEPGNGQMQLNIYNSLGKEALSVSSYFSGTAIDISDFRAGIYLIKVTGSKSSLIKKIVKTN